MTGSPSEESRPAAGGTRELLRLAWPFILSNSFYTLQILLDRVLLSRSGSAEVGAGMAAALLYWTPINLLQNTANYATTFVAQYTGAGEPRRVGPVVWQALHFALVAGVLFMAARPLVGPVVAWGGHEPHLQALETTYLSILTLAGLPLLVNAAACSFFAGRGDSRTVLGVNASGLAVNGVCAYLLIFGRPELGVPALGIAGAGWATVIGSTVSALVAVGLMLRPRYGDAFGTRSGWRPDPALFRRLMRFSVPNGVFAALDVLGFALFVQFVGRLGPAELAATSVTFTLNLVAFLPMMGIGQAVEVLVGQRLGEDRPDAASRSAWAGLRLAMLFTTVFVLAFLLAPGPLVALFEGHEAGADRDAVRALVPVLLRFVAAYCLFDTFNLVFSYALRGAGDTRFVTWVGLGLSGPVLVLPTWASWRFGWGLYWAWTFVTLYIVLLALAFLARFIQGKWRAMRVIETPPAAVAGAPSVNGTAGADGVQQAAAGSPAVLDGERPSR
jgi:MATE family multidrug resistance protein